MEIKEKHLFLPVTCTVYDPAVNPDAEDPVPPLGFHRYLNGPIPPEIFTEAPPSFPPLQLTGVSEANVIFGAPIFETIAISEAVHPVESTTVIVYAPAGIFEMVSLFEFRGVQKYEYPTAPPVTETLALPFDLPQEASVVVIVNVVVEMYINYGS